MLQTFKLNFLPSHCPLSLSGALLDIATRTDIIVFRDAVMAGPGAYMMLSAKAEIDASRLSQLQNMSLVGVRLSMVVVLTYKPADNMYINVEMLGYKLQLCEPAGGWRQGAQYIETTFQTNEHSHCSASEFCAEMPSDILLSTTSHRLGTVVTARQLTGGGTFSNTTVSVRVPGNTGGATTIKAYLKCDSDSSDLTATISNVGLNIVACTGRHYTWYDLGSVPDTAPNGMATLDLTFTGTSTQVLKLRITSGQGYFFYGQLPAFA